METKTYETAEVSLFIGDIKVYASGGKLGEISDWEFEVSFPNLGLSSRIYYYGSECFMDGEDLESAVMDFALEYLKDRSQSKVELSEYEEEEETE